ncbi:verprolin-like protein [Lates japonicus]|uniref:Verprolin-like protein n=1 Tax=Lates japonicus TaxID=270547 RepID=A0AAD3MZI2_LATJO|nr:verprolin-like protein [Lates japonicus]
MWCLVAKQVGPFHVYDPTASYRSDLYMQPRGLTMDPQPQCSNLHHYPDPCPQDGRISWQRPSSAPSQHLLGGLPRALAPEWIFSSQPGGCKQRCDSRQDHSLCTNAHTGVPCLLLDSSLHQPQSTPGPGTKTFILFPPWSPVKSPQPSPTRQ